MKKKIGGIFLAGLIFIIMLKIGIWGFSFFITKLQETKAASLNISSRALWIIIITIILILCITFVVILFRKKKWKLSGTRSWSGFWSGFEKFWKSIGAMLVAVLIAIGCWWLFSGAKLMARRATEPPQSILIQREVRANESNVVMGEKVLYKAGVRYLYERKQGKPLHYREVSAPVGIRVEQYANSAVGWDLDIEPNGNVIATNSTDDGTYGNTMSIRTDRDVWMKIDY